MYRFLLGSIFVTLNLHLSICGAVDQSRLWLPQKYNKLYVDLLAAAESAKTVERCTEVVDGTVDLGQSTKEHPVYRILCRQVNGRTYNEMVDGLSFETLTTPKPVELILSAEELERIRLEAEIKRQVQIKNLKSSYWQACQSAVQKKAYLMQDLVWLTTEEPEAQQFTEIDNSSSIDEAQKTNQSDANGSDKTEIVAEAIYGIDFNAENLQGAILKYRASCHIDNARNAKVTIRKR